ncbi:retrovirus-related Pol polyprotein from transposon opus [Nephila pilipes]|uniref:Retrovirus-related Pol polyprotein from transposon opus n=1 Tax=Nephila pilipes TaxID=299642 RepID=A0A8X6UDD8_NEPPI|nr:retrovirus-related Pol polyprotein from transposon opus [Nephila pilipes]
MLIPWQNLSSKPFILFPDLTLRTKALGARVVIHHTNETPSPEDQGFNAIPGNEISVSLRQSITYRLPTPFRDHCVDYERSQGSSVSHQQDCVRTCIQTENFAKCGCIDSTLNVMEYLKLCDLTNTTQMCCLDDVLETLSKNGPFCDSPQPCTSVSFNEILSRAVWPSKAMLNNVVADALSRIDAINENNYDAIAKEQVKDEDLKQFMQNNSSLKFKPSTLPSGKTHWCDISTPKIRPYIPQIFRLQILQLIHGFVHTGVKSTIKLMTEKHVWSNIKKKVREWAKVCIRCQKCKFTRHTKSKFGEY